MAGLKTNLPYGATLLPSAADEDICRARIPQEEQGQVTPAYGGQDLTQHMKSGTRDDFFNGPGYGL